MKKKYYTVWNGNNPGVYDNWADCKREVAGYPNALYKSFGTLEEARQALEEGYRASSPSVVPVGKKSDGFIEESIAVDAACSGNPGKVEYRGVYVKNGTVLFQMGPFEHGTNNIGEFLALVHALAFLKQRNCVLPIYSDSRNAIAWVRQKKCKTQLARSPLNKPLFDLVERAEYWLRNNTYSSPIMKWETAVWGEIPADYGRKNR